MADQQQHMTFVERYRMQPDIAAALIEWRDSKATLADSERVPRREDAERYHKAERALLEIARGLPVATRPTPTGGADAE